MVWICFDLLAHINGWLRCTFDVQREFDVTSPNTGWPFFFADREYHMPICSTIMSFDVFIKRQNYFTMPAKLSAHSSRNSLCWMERTVCIHFFTSVISNSRLCCVSRLLLNLKPPSSPCACFIWNAVFRVSGLQFWMSLGTVMDCGNFVFLFVFWLVGFSPQGTRASTAPFSSQTFMFYFIHQMLYHLFSVSFACIYFCLFFPEQSCHMCFIKIIFHFSRVHFISHNFFFFRIYKHSFCMLLIIAFVCLHANFSRKKNFGQISWNGFSMANVYTNN